VRTRSFRVAARERGLTQGAVSQQLRKLETVLGVRLIGRGARRCAPTLEGEEFTGYAEGLLRLNARAIEALGSRRIAIGASSNIGTYLLQPHVRAFLEETGGRHPVEIQIHQNPAVATRLERNEIDVAIMEWWDGRPGFLARVWRQEELVVIVPPEHSWAELSSISRAQLKDAPMLGGEPGTGTGRLLARYFGPLAHELKPAMRLGSTEAVKQWVKAGLGVSVVLVGTVATEVRAGTLVAIPLEGEAPHKEIFVICRDTLAATSTARRFADWLIGRSSGSLPQPALRRSAATESERHETRPAARF
jgi:DNA-binding transcriptional LysR family regulator